MLSRDPKFVASMAKMGHDAPVYAYALNNPINFTDPTGLAVYLCKRKADIPGNPGFQHWWVVTGAGSGGMGACGGGVPGHGGSDSPYYTDTCVNDHSGENTCGSGVTCELMNDVDEACVNSEVLQSKALGAWSAGNQCQSFAAGVLDRCRKKNSCGMGGSGPYSSSGGQHQF